MYNLPIIYNSFLPQTEEEFRRFRKPLIISSLISLVLSGAIFVWVDSNNFDKTSAKQQAIPYQYSPK